MSEVQTLQQLEPQLHQLVLSEPLPVRLTLCYLGRKVIY